MRLWSGKGHVWNNEYSKDMYKSWRWYLTAECNGGRHSYLGLFIQSEALRIDDTYALGPDYYSIGIRNQLCFGYDCVKYDGFHKSFSLGPFFISWYSDNE